MPLYNFSDLVKNAESYEEKPRFTLLEDGDYDFAIRELPEVNEEKMNIKIKAVVASGDRAKYTHFHYLTFKPDAHPFAAKQTLKLLNATGLTNDQISKAQSLTDFANFLVGKTFTATVTTRDNNYNGETRKQNNLLDFRPSTVAAGSGVPNPGNTPSVPQSTPSVPQTAPSAPQAAPSAPQTPSASNPDPWGTADTNGPSNGGFQAPPMPFGN